MSQIINELATIEVSNEVIQQLDLAGIYRSFRENYKKLDDLKNFRSGYEKQNRVMRWWHNDKLRDAQLDSAEVQGEFSRTIGQLMMISIIQSRKLAEQQALLNEQQHKLTRQADGIAENAATLQGQHRKLAEQSSELKTLVEDYIALKGLTEEGTNKLVAIAKEIKATKESMVLHVDERTQAVEAQCSDVAARMQALSMALEEKTLACMTALSKNEANQQSSNARLQTGLSELAVELEQRSGEHVAEIATMRGRADEIADKLSASNSELAVCAQQQAQMHTLLTSLTQQSQSCVAALHKQEASQQARNARLESALFQLTTQVEQQSADHAAHIAGLESYTQQIADGLSASNSELAACAQQQQDVQRSVEGLRHSLSIHIKRSTYVAAGLSVIAIAGLLGAAGLIG